MNSQYAILDINGIVTNIIMWDGKTTYNLPEDNTLIIIPEDLLMNISIGSTYNLSTNSFDLPKPINLSLEDLQFMWDNLNEEDKLEFGPRPE